MCDRCRSNRPCPSSPRSSPAASSSWQGRAYVGNFGWDYEGGAPQRNAALALVHPDGRVVRAADDLAFPNGTVITPDGGTLIVAETFARCLTAFDVAPGDGTLSNRRLW